MKISSFKGDKMRKFKRIFSSILLTIIILLPKSVLADGFKYINLDVNIDKNGKASVSEEWQIDERDNDYSERYKRIENLKGIKIENFKASLNGEEFSEKDPWNVDENFDQKTFYYGRNDSDDAVELCWGISERGENNTYEISYDINPIIIGLDDSDMLFFKFVGSDFDPKPEKVNVKINSYEPIDKDVKMWGFGFEGDIKNNNGSIIANSTGEVDNVNIMLKFPKGSFNTSYREDKSFRDYANQAVEGSDWENNEGEVQKDEFGPKEFLLVLLGIGIMSGIIAAIASKIAKNSPTYIANLKELPKKKALKDYRYSDIPYDGNLEDLYLIAVNAYPFSQNVDTFINAFFLKWINEGAISYFERESGAVLKETIKKDKTGEIIIKHRPENMGQVEQKVFTVLENIGKENSKGKITEKSLKKYLEENNKELDELSKELAENSKKALEKAGYLEIIRGKKHDQTILNQKGKDLYKNYIGFNNYLENYNDIENIKDTKTLDKFLIYAAIFGITKKVYKSFNKAYSDYSFNNLYTYTYLNNIHSFSSYASGNGESFSSAGSGGSTSFGGGGGGFGGGGGGGR